MEAQKIGSGKYKIAGFIICKVSSFYNGVSWIVKNEDGSPLTKDQRVSGVIKNSKTLKDSVYSIKSALS